MATKEKKAAAQAKGLSRIASVKSQLSAEAKVKADYVKYGTAGIEEINCKLCGQHLRELRPDNRFREKRNINGKDVIVERLVLATTPFYNEVAIFFDDGSRHVTILCNECAAALTMDQANAVYVMDMDVLQKEAGNFPWEVFADRVPVSFEVFPPGKSAG